MSERQVLNELWDEINKHMCEHMNRIESNLNHDKFVEANGFVKGLQFARNIIERKMNELKCES